MNYFSYLCGIGTIHILPTKITEDMAYFNSYTDVLDMNFWRELCRRNGTMRRLKKGEWLARRGDRLRYWGIIERGYVKFIAHDDEGDAHITGFAFCNELAGDYLSMVRAEPVKTDIIAATATDVLMCGTDVFNSVFEERPEMRLALAEKLFRQAYTQYLDLHIKSPKERYVALLKRCPTLLHSITLREMASYLQITPTHLSRIRRELTFCGQAAGKP